MRVYLWLGILCGIIGLGSSVYGLYSGIERYSIVAIIFYSCGLCFNLWIFVKLMGLFKECKILRKVEKEMYKQDVVIYRGAMYKKGDTISFKIVGDELPDIRIIRYFNCTNPGDIKVCWNGWGSHFDNIEFLHKCGTKVEEVEHWIADLYKTIGEQQKTIDILESKIVNLKKQMEENQGPKFEVGDKVRTEHGSFGIIVACDLSENDYCVAWVHGRSMHMDWYKPHLLKLISKGEQS